MPAPTREALRALAGRFALVACVSGRRGGRGPRAGRRRRAGLCRQPRPRGARPGRARAGARPGTRRAGRGGAGVRRSRSTARRSAAPACGSRTRGPIQALHWRGAADEAAAEREARRDRRAGRGARAWSRTGVARCWSCGRSPASTRGPRFGGCSIGTASSLALFARRRSRPTSTRSRAARAGARRRAARGASASGSPPTRRPPELAEEADAVVERPRRAARDADVCGGARCPAGLLMLFVDLLRADGAADRRRGDGARARSTRRGRQPGRRRARP